MSKIFQNTFFYAIGNFTSKAINFLLLPLYTSYLTPEEFGIVSSMQVFTSILLIFLTLGLERAIYRLFFDYKTEKEKKNFLGTIAISITIISALVCGGLFLLNAPIGKIYKSINFHPYYTYAILTALFMSYELVPQISMQVREQAKQYLFLSLTIMLFRIAPVIWQVVYLDNRAVGMLKGAMIGNAAALLVLVPKTFKIINIYFNVSLLKQTLKYCLPFIPIIISGWVINMSDRIFLERFFSTHEVGIYSLAYKIGQLVQFLSVSILMAYNPYFYKKANSEDQIQAKKDLYKMNNLSISFLLLIGFLTAFFAKDIINLFFNKQYSTASGIVPIIVLGYFFIQLISIQTLSFYQEKKTFSIMIINIIAACVNIGLNFILISNYGYFGAAISTLLTQFIYFIIIYYYSRKYYFIPLNFKLLIPLFLFFNLLFFISYFLIPITYTNLILKAIGVLLFFVFTYIIITKYFNRKNLELKFFFPN